MKKLKKVSLQLFELQAEKILEIPDRQSTEKEAWELLKAKKFERKEEAKVVLYLSRTCFILVRPIFTAIIWRDFSKGSDKNHL